MGKGNRNRETRTFDQIERPAKYGASQKGGSDSKRTLLVAVVAILVIGLAAVGVLGGSGILDRSTVVIESENYRVTGTMIPVFEYDAYTNIFDYYYQMYYAMTGDANTAYSSVQQSLGSYTLKDFFDTARQTAKEYVTLCEAAKAAGVSLDEDDFTTIDESVDAIKTNAGSFGAVYGSGVKEKDVRKALELQLLATKYYKTVEADLKGTITEEEIDANVEANKSNYYVSEYLSQTFAIAANEVDNFADAKAEAAKYAEALLAAKSEDEFKTAIAKYVFDTKKGEKVEKNMSAEIRPSDDELAQIMESVYADILSVVIDGKELEMVPTKEGATEKEIALNTSISLITKLLIQDVESAISGGRVQLPYADPAAESATDLQKFLFAEGAKVGDVKKIEKTSTDETENYTVYYIVDTLHKDDDMTKNVGHILIKTDLKTYEEGASDEKIAEVEAENEKILADAKAKAEDVLALFILGEQTEEAFEKLAEVYNDDSNVFYRNVREGDMVEEFEDWLFDDARKIDDVEIVQTDYGYHVMYYRGEEIEWHANASQAVLNDKYDAWLEDSFKTYNVTENEKAIKKYGVKLTEDETAA